MDYRQNTDRDELRAEFTVWLDTSIRRAKLDYLRKHHVPLDIMSLEELHEENMPVSEEDIRKYMTQDIRKPFTNESERKSFVEKNSWRVRTEEINRILSCLEENQ